MVLAGRFGLSEVALGTEESPGFQALQRRGKPDLSSSQLRPLASPGVVKSRKYTNVCPSSLISSSQQPCEVDVIPSFYRWGNWGSERLNYLGSYSKEVEDLGLGTRFVGSGPIFLLQGLRCRWWGGRGSEGWEKREKSHYQQLIPCLPPQHVYIQSTPTPVLSFTWGLHKTKRARLFLPFLKSGNGGTERWSDLLKVTQP